MIYRPLKHLNEGGSITRDTEGSVVKSISQIKPNDRISVQLIDGSLACRVEEEVSSELSELISMEETHD